MYKILNKENSQCFIQDFLQQARVQVQKPSFFFRKLKAFKKRHPIHFVFLHLSFPFWWLIPGDY